MNEEKQFADLLKQSLAPADSKLLRDLWPGMLRRLDESASRRSWFVAMASPRAVAAVPWFDWAFLAVLVLGICLFPRSIPIWLYHL